MIDNYNKIENTVDVYSNISTDEQKILTKKYPDLFKSVYNIEIESYDFVYTSYKGFVFIYENDYVVIDNGVVTVYNKDEFEKMFYKKLDRKEES